MMLAVSTMLVYKLLRIQCYMTEFLHMLTAVWGSWELLSSVVLSKGMMQKEWHSSHHTHFPYTEKDVTSSSWHG